MANVQSLVSSSSNYMEGMKLQQVPLGDNILTAECLAFLGDLHRDFNGRRKLLLEASILLHQERNCGVVPKFSDKHLNLRQDEWKSEKATDLKGLQKSRSLDDDLDGKVVDMNNIVLPIWENSVKIQALLHQKIKEGQNIIIEPRGLNYNEKSLVIDGEPVSGALVDFAIFYVKNVPLVDKVTVYLSSLTSQDEAIFWKDVFDFTQQYFKTDIDCILSIENLDSLFQTEEILHQLRQYVVGIHHNRYRYMTSFISITGEVLAQDSQLTYKAPILFYYISMLKDISQRRHVKFFNDPLPNVHTPSAITEENILDGDILGGCIMQNELESTIQTCMRELTLWWSRIPADLSRTEFFRAQLSHWVSKMVYLNNGVQLASADVLKLVREYSTGQNDVDNLMSPNMLSLSVEDYVTLKTYESTISKNMTQQKL